MPIEASYDELIPTTEPDAVEGRLYYDATEKVLKYYNGMQWIEVGAVTGYSEFDNNGGGAWTKYINIPITSIPSEYAQYRIEIDSTNVTVYSADETQKTQGAVASDFWANVKSDGSDIRLFDQAKNQLYFWIESWDYSGAQATIWVNVPAGASEVNVAYGNGNASQSDFEGGAQVFEFFDDFEDNDISDWEVGDNVGAVFDTKPSVENGYVRSTGEKQGMHKSISLQLDNYVLGLRIYFSGDEKYNYMWVGLINTPGSSAKYYAHLCTQSSPTHEGMQVRKDEFWELEALLARDDTETFEGNTWHNVEFIHKADGSWAGKHNGNDVDFEYQNTPDTSYNYFTSICLAFRLPDQRCDLIYVLKLADPADFDTPTIMSF